MGLTDIQYKESETGVIPVDWEVKKLCEISVIATGNTPPTNDPSNYGDEFLFVSPADLGKGKWITQTEKKLSRKGFSISRKFPKNSILFTCIGSTIGKSGMAHQELTSNQQINAVLPSSKYSYDFIFYALDYISPRIKSIAGEQAVPIVNKTLFGETLLAVPHIKSEQTAIATALSDADALIENLEELIVKKRNIRQGAMQELLSGKMRLSGFEGNWKSKLLGDMADIKTGKKNNDDKIEHGIYPFFVRSQTVERINSYSFDGEAILIPGEGNIGSIYHYINGKFDYHQRVYKISNFDKKICVKYVYYFMLQNFNAHAMKNTVKATVDSLRLPNFQRFEVYLPPHLEEQKAIARILTDFETEIEILQEKLLKYRMTKHAMMQTLLTGKIRLL